MSGKTSEMRAYLWRLDMKLFTYQFTYQSVVWMTQVTAQTLFDLLIECIGDNGLSYRQLSYPEPMQPHRRHHHYLVVVPVMDGGIAGRDIQYFSSADTQSISQIYRDQEVPPNEEDYLLTLLSAIGAEVRQSRLGGDE